MPRLSSTSRHEHVARWFFVVVTLLVLFLFWKILEPFALVLLTAGVMAVIFTPVEKRLRAVLKSAKLSALASLLIVLLAVVGPLVTAGFIVVNQVTDLVQGGAAGWLQNFRWEEQTFFADLPAVIQTQLSAVDVQGLLVSLQNWATDHIGTIFSSSATFLFSTFIFFVCFFYFLLDREMIVAEVLALSPFKDRTDKSILDRMTTTVRAVVLGSLIVAVVQAVMAAIGMTIFGVPGALIWAGLIVIAAQVPMVGTAAVMVPVVAYMFLSGNTEAAIGLGIWAIVVVGTIDNVLAPFVVKGKTRMHALLILLSILGGLQVFGPIGFIVGPTVLAGLFALLELYRAGVLEKENL